MMDRAGRPKLSKDGSGAFGAIQCIWTKMGIEFSHSDISFNGLLVNQEFLTMKDYKVVNLENLFYQYPVVYNRKYFK